MTDAMAVEIDPFTLTWHYQAHHRIEEGINQKLSQICDKHHVTAVFLLDGMWEWFKTEQPEAYKKYHAADGEIDRLWVEGRTDAEAQKEFNTQLRIYRDGTYWLMEKYVNWKTERTNKGQADAAMTGTQEAMTLQ